MLSKPFIFDLTQGSLKSLIYFLRGNREIDLRIQKNSIWLYFFDSLLITISELEYQLYYIRFYNYCIPEIEGPFVSPYKHYMNESGHFKSLIIYPQDHEKPDKIKELKQLIFESHSNIKDDYEREAYIDDSDIDLMFHYGDGYPFRQYFIRSNSMDIKLKPTDIYIIDSDRRPQRGEKTKKPYDMVGVSLIAESQIKFYLISLIPHGRGSNGRQYFEDIINQPNIQAHFIEEMISLFYLKANVLGLIPGVEISDEILEDLNPDEREYAIEYLYVYCDNKGVIDPLEYLRVKLKKFHITEFSNKLRFTTVTSSRQQLRNEFIYDINQIFSKV
jgi:hypothetical protein